MNTRRQIGKDYRMEVIKREKRENMETTEQVLEKRRNICWMSYVKNILGWSDPCDGRFIDAQQAFKAGYEHGMADGIKLVETVQKLKN